MVVSLEKKRGRKSLVAALEVALEVALETVLVLCPRKNRRPSCFFTV
jgi:hypothetical protein